MDKITSDRVRELCSLIQVEQDAGKFLELIQELNRLLDGKGTSSQEGGASRSIHPLNHE